MHEERVSMLEGWLCMHARCMNADKMVSSIVSTYLESKLILNMFLPLLGHQVFIWTHPTIETKHLHVQKHIKQKIKAKLKIEKSLKNLPIQPVHPSRDGFVAWRSEEGTPLALWLHPSRWDWRLRQKSCRRSFWFWVPLDKMREFERRRKFQIVRNEEMKRVQELFVEKERKLKGWEEMKRWRE